MENTLKTIPPLPNEQCPNERGKCFEDHSLCIDIEFDHDDIFGYRVFF